MIFVQNMKASPKKNEEEEEEENERKKVGLQ